MYKWYCLMCYTELSRKHKVLSDVYKCECGFVCSNEAAGFIHPLSEAYVKTLDPDENPYKM